MPRYTKAEQEARDDEQARACDLLRELLPVASDINIICTEYSRTGSTSAYRVLIADKETGNIRDISSLVAVAIDAKRSDAGAIKSGGWGLSRAFQIVYNLGRALYPDGALCTGESCCSNDHRNGDRDYTPHIHSDGGYAYRMNQL